MTAPAPSRAPIPTQLAVTRQAWRFARFAGDTEKAEKARLKIDVLLDLMNMQRRVNDLHARITAAGATLPRQEQP